MTRRSVQRTPSAQQAGLGQSGLSMSRGPISRRPISRRAFLNQAVATGALTAGGALLAGCSTSPSFGGPATTLGSAPPDTTPIEPTGRLVPGRVDGRILVIVDLQGGNDGLSTAIPADSSIYHDLRPNLAHDDGDVLGVDDRIGLNPNLTRLNARGLTIVEGVGPAADGDLSHFAMTERWERGDATGAANQRTGFLGRLTDALDDGGVLVGASMAGPTPHFVNTNASTLALSDMDALWFLEENDWADAAGYRDLVSSFAPISDHSAESQRLSAMVPSAFDTLIDLADRLGGDDDDEVDWEDPMLESGGDLGRQLYLAADLLAADVGTRVVYASHGDFDTHEGHMYRHDDLMGQLDVAVDGFLRRVDDAGLADQVMVATISEFGRRVAENERGLDHGSASSMLVAGPTSARVLGEPSPLDELDEDGNLVTTVGFDRYLASLAEEWLGVEAASVLPDEPAPLGLV